MKVQEAFVVPDRPEVLWDFFEQIDRVAGCVPGVEDVTVVDADNSRLVVTQSLGPLSATFDLKMRITHRDPGRAMEFTAIGRTVRGAAGAIRSTSTVRLEPVHGRDETRVVLDADLALGGMIGSVGQKVVAKQASKVTRAFAEALQRELHPDSAPEAEPERGPEAPAAPGKPAAARSLPLGTVEVPAPLLALLVFALGYLVGRRR